MKTTIGIILFNDAEELDWAGPFEVFQMARLGQHDLLETLIIAETPGPVRCFNGLRVLPDATFESAPELDVLCVPGGQGTRTEAHNPVILDYLRKAAPRCRWVTSVCTGALLLHHAGLTRGKKVTTHWAFVSQLREIADDSTVLDHYRYVRDGNLLTAAGVSAGIDMSLWLVGELFGVDHARKTQKLMEYDPAPPYGALT